MGRTNIPSKRKPGEKKKPRPSTKSIAAQVLQTVKNRKKRETPEEETGLTLLPTPSSLFNCACSDRPDGAFSLGRMVNLIGDSSSGKTLVALSVLAEAANHPAFKEYRLIFDDVENALAFDCSYMFGEAMSCKMEPPAVDEAGAPLPSNTIEDFHCNIRDALDEGRPFIYVLDSFDALDAEGDQKKLEEFRDARKKGNKTSGTYAMAKPKKSSELLRNICAQLKRTNSVLIIISQTRDNIDPLSFEKKTRSGGRALKFYAFHEVWLAMAGKIPKRERIIGNRVQAKVSKNKLTGKLREVGFPIYYDYGVDDLASCIQFMVKEGFWKKSKLTIHAEDLNISGTQAKLIQEIEDRGLERKLRRAVGKAWLEIEEELKLNRKPKYK